MLMRELEVPMEVLTKTALETPIPTTPTMKSKLAPNESLGDHIDLTGTDSEEYEAEFTPADVEDGADFATDRMECYRTHTKRECVRPIRSRKRGSGEPSTSSAVS